jgi:NAD(P)H-dependent flavin oxidoreductase YrpB (nitropropane dioxygenase family)
MRDAIGDMPLVAAGGIGDGAAWRQRAVGADGVCMERDSSAPSKPRLTQNTSNSVIEAVATDTICGTLFDGESSDAPLRTLRTKVVEDGNAPDGRPRVSGRAKGN